MHARCLVCTGNVVAGASQNPVPGRITSVEADPLNLPVRAVALGRSLSQGRLVSAQPRTEGAGEMSRSAGWSSLERLISAGLGLGFVNQTVSQLKHTQDPFS